MKQISIIFFLSLALLFSACNRKHPPVLIESYDSTPTYDPATSLYPESLEAFKEAIDASKYQFEHNNTVVHIDNLDGYKTKNFYADSNETLYFVLTKAQNTHKERNELRQIREWSTADSNGNFYVATLRCYKPAPPLESYTWMQIHGSHESYNYPILRLLWVRNREGVKDHNWAIILTNYNTKEKIYEWVDLGERSSTFFNAAVYVQNNIMKIIINNKLKKKMDVSYWENVKNYFKAGVYINREEDGGTAVVAYKKLKILNWADPDLVY